MSLQTMPGDILLGILQCVSSWEACWGVDFKRQLKVLGIFQRLRVLALPKIYNHVYIYFSEHGYHSRQKYLNKYSEKFDNCINTNADIIALANCTHMVKSIKIDIFGLGVIYGGLHRSIEALQACANAWPSITKLNMYMGYHDSIRRRRETLLDELHVDKSYSQELIKVMPGVTELSLSSSYDNWDINKCFNLVSGAYAEQLVKLANSYDMDLSDERNFKVIQCLNIDMSDSSMVLPRVNSQTLVILCIQNIHYNCSWAPFLVNKNDTAIEFPCLKRLRLEFSDYKSEKYYEGNNHYEPELQLNFPNLSLLTLICSADVSSFFKMARLPDEMDSISIEAPQQFLAQFNNIQLPKATKFSISPYP